MKRATPAFCAALLILAGPVFGHARLLRASPAADARLIEAPRSLTLTFNENVRLTALKLWSAGHEIVVRLDRSAVAAPDATIALPPLAAGRYEVAWTALTPSDAHVVQGTYAFVVLSRP